MYTLTRYEFTAKRYFQKFQLKYKLPLKTMYAKPDSVKLTSKPLKKKRKRKGLYSFFNCAHSNLKTKDH